MINAGVAVMMTNGTSPHDFMNSAAPWWDDVADASVRIIAGSQGTPSACLPDLTVASHACQLLDYEGYGCREGSSEHPELFIWQPHAIKSALRASSDGRALSTLLERRGPCPYPVQEIRHLARLVTASAAGRRHDVLSRDWWPGAARLLATSVVHHKCR